MLNQTNLSWWGMSVHHGNSHISTTRLKRNRRIMAILILIIVFFFSCYTPKFVIIVFFAFKNVAQVYQVYFLLHLYILPTTPKYFFQPYYHIFVQFKLPRSPEKLSTGCMRQGSGALFKELVNQSTLKEIVWIVMGF